MVSPNLCPAVLSKLPAKVPDSTTASREVTLTSTIGVLLVEAGVDDAALLVIEALRPAGGRARPSSIRAVHMKLQWDVPFM
jgi:hypothetical protein